MGKHKLTKEQVEEIRRLWWEDELSYKQIGKRFNISPGNAHLIVQGRIHHDENYSSPSAAEGKRRMKRGGKSKRQFSDDDVLSIFKMWKSGEYTVQQIADSLDATLSAVENVLYGQTYIDTANRAREKLGISRVKRGGITRVLHYGEMHTILKLFYSGLTAHQVAKLVGRPYSTVQNVLYDKRYRETVQKIKAELGVLP